MANYLDYDGLLYLKGKLDDTYQAQESGKGLSTNDYTNADKAKVDGAIQNPTTKSNGQVLTYNGTNWVAQNPAETGVLSVTAKNDTITVDNTDDSNPTIKITDSYVTTWNGKQNAISDLATIRSGAQLGATAVQPSALADYVPTSRTVNGKALSSNVTLVPADLGLGSVFKIKGSKPTASQLPTTGNEIGDVWYVLDESVGYVWLNDGTTNRWEKLGMDVSLNGYWQGIDNTGSYYLTNITNAQIDTIFA